MTRKIIVSSLCAMALAMCLPVPVQAQMPFDQARKLVETRGGVGGAQVAQRAEPEEKEEPAAKGEEFDEGLFEDAIEPGKKPVPTPPAGATPGEKPAEPVQNRKLTINAVVVVDYVFFHSPDRFKVKYHLNMGGDIPNDVSVLKGSAKVSTDVNGFLAKWGGGECILKVSISEVPYEITFKKSGDNEADVEVKFPQPIMEDWESLCTFVDDPNAHFNTRGNPEKWIAGALEKTSPALNKLVTPLKEEEPTSLKFTISKHTVKDENIGSAEIDGTGAVTVEPGSPPPEEGQKAASK